MQTTTEWLDAVKARHNVSDYALAPLLKVTKSQISRYRKGHDVLSGECAQRVAELLAADPAFVRACVEVERAERDRDERGRAMWERIALAFRGAAVVAAVSLAALIAPERAQAAKIGFDITKIHIALRRWLAAMFTPRGAYA